MLGLLGVAPFVVLAVARPLGQSLIGGDSWWRAYGAVILSFMGGAQWGLTAARSPGPGSDAVRGFSVSILPAIVAWLSLAADGRPGLAMMLAAFLLLLGYDLWTVGQGQAPPWYGRLRIILTLAVAACLSVSLFTIRA